MNKKTKVAINGLGRIGRAFLKLALQSEDIEIVAINDLGDLDNLAYLLKYDSAYGITNFSVEVKDDKLLIVDKEIIFLQEKDPQKLPWKDLAIDVVIEATGFFTEYSKAADHIKAGAKKVVISAPAKGESPQDISCGMVLLGINDNNLRDIKISSNASCTTNAAGPVIASLHEKIGIEKALLNTVHAYTSGQKMVDSPDNKDWRRGRAGAVNIIPSTTGAAKAVTEIITDLDNKFDGLAIRVPVVCGSLVDITFTSSRPTTIAEVNSILEQASKEDKWQGILETSKEQLVSSDIVGSTFASIVDLSFTKVVDGDLVKVLAWYDNEMGYAHTLVKHAILTDKLTEN